MVTNQRANESSDSSAESRSEQRASALASHAPDTYGVFRTSSGAAEGFHLVHFDGREALSELYRFDLIVQSPSGPLDASTVDSILVDDAIIEFGLGHIQKVHGILSEFEMLPMMDMERVSYRAVVVPKLWLLTQTSGSWVYQHMTVQQIIEDVLEDYGLTSGTDYEIKCNAQHPAREFTMQYEETDYAFLSRLMEYEGIFFFFEHEADGAKLIITDNNEAFAPATDYQNIPYNSGLDGGDDVRRHESINTLSRGVRRLPKNLKLRDYNYRTPSLPLQEQADIDATNGAGRLRMFGENFPTPAEGKRLAKLRAQAHTVRREFFQGTGRVPGMRPGNKFTLENHPIAALDTEFVVTEIHHSVTQRDAMKNRSGGSDDADLKRFGLAEDGYTNSFSLITSPTVYRPQLLAPRPRIVGFVHARIDAPGASGTGVPIDDQGRYRVLFPFDNGAKKGGRATCWIPMALTTTGASHGINFPLHAGADVVIAFIDGDPDRPIIAGALPTPATPTVALATNATQSVIRTRAGIAFEFEDDA